MRVEITIDCIDDTKRIPQGQVIQWFISGEKSRDYKIHDVGQVIANALKAAYPRNEDGRKIVYKPGKRK